VRRIGLVCLLLLLAAGCGGAARARRPAAPRLPHALAVQWASEAANVAIAAQAHQGCRAQQLARSLAEQVAQRSGRVPSRLRTPLLTSVTALEARIACVRVVQPKQPAGPPPKKPKERGHGPKPPHGPGPMGEGD
jgi:hypothetical protein